MIVIYKLHLATKSALLIGGQYSSLTLDKMTARYTEEDDPTKKDQPYIPASALKGAMRIDFERLVRNRDSRICHASNPEKMCPGPDFCPACVLFGNPNRPGKLRFFDAQLRNSPPSAQQSYQERTGVAISRALRRAEPKKLFNFEATATGMELAFEARIECLEMLTNEEQQLLEGCLRWWSEEGLYLGGSRSRGLGWLKLQYEREERVTAEAPATPPSAAPNTQPALYRVVFNPEERLRISGLKPRQYLLPTLRFIPGSTLRGALAHALKRKGATATALERLFLHQPLEISHLYPERFGLGKDALRPATAWECKCNPGRHGPYDLLIDHFLYGKALELSNQLSQEQLEQLRRRAEECLKCDSPLRPGGGFPHQLSNPKLYAKLALNRTLMRAEHGMFYLYEAIKPKQFEGLMWLTPEQYQAFSSVTEVLIGGARSKGFGRGGLTIRSAPSGFLGDQMEIKRRLKAFNDRLQQRAKTFEPLAQFVKDRHFFTLDLLTDLVVPPTMSLQQIVQHLNLNWRWEMAVLHWVKVGGYNEAVGQEKPSLSALEKGGTVLLSVASSDLNQTIKQLVELENQGLGLKRDEGFGWVQICSPFHVEEVQP